MICGTKWFHESVGVTNYNQAKHDRDLYCFVTLFSLDGFCIRIQSVSRIRDLVTLTSQADRG